MRCAPARVSGGQASAGLLPACSRDGGDRSPEGVRYALRSNRLRELSRPSNNAYSPSFLEAFARIWASISSSLAMSTPRLASEARAFSPAVLALVVCF